MNSLENVNIVSLEPLPTPAQIKQECPINDTVINTVSSARASIKKILNWEDYRLMVVVGPCSIHDEALALDYAKRIKELSAELRDNFFIIMRVYFEKPRTNIGWKGFINDPYLDGTFRIDEGLRRARSLMVKISEMGVPIATEVLDPFTPQYLDDLISWAAIGARTVESQTHREMASGLSMPVGFKNSTDGTVSVAVNALKTVANPHHFLGMDENGRCCVCSTKGNSLGHIVLRGGTRPNYDCVSVDECEKELIESGLPKNIMIDCSHGNSFKQFALQGVVLNRCITQIFEGNTSFIGFMLESNICEGNQKMSTPENLKYGVSITDACIGWDETVELLRNANMRLGDVLKNRRK